MRPMPSWANDLLSQIMSYLERGKENKARTAKQQQVGQSHTELDMILEPISALNPTLVLQSEWAVVEFVLSHIQKGRSECY